MKTVRNLLFIFATLWIAIPGFGQREDTEEFVIAIVELSRNEQNNVEIEIKSAKSFPKKLKRPTVSDRRNSDDFNFYRFQVVDERSKVLDEVTLKDPFHIDFEYVNHDGQLAHKTVESEKRVYVIRRKIQNTATHMVVRPAISVRSDDFVMVKIERQ